MIDPDRYLNYTQPRHNCTYLCPPPFDSNFAQPSEHDQLAWVNKVLSIGNNYLQSQPAFSYIKEGTDIVNDLWQQQNSNATLSDASLGTVTRNTKEVIASLSNLRVIPAFASQNSEKKEVNAMLNKMYIAWQKKTFADRQYRKVVQYSTACGTSYGYIHWDGDFEYPGKGDQVIEALDPLSILPIGLPKNHDLQKAYAVAIKFTVPYHYIINKYPDRAHLVHPTQGTNAGMKGNILNRVVEASSAVLRKFGTGTNRTSSHNQDTWENVDLYHIYVDDRSVNWTGRTLLMGDPGTNWAYTVPYVGQQIPVGDPEAMVFREATVDDCRIYPNRRRVIATSDCILNPDVLLQVNPYWHGKVPIAQFLCEDWPFNFLGFPLAKSGKSLEKANNQLMRGSVDSSNVRLSPPRAFDRNTMSETLAQTFNPRIPNQVVGIDSSLGAKSFEPLVPADYYNVPDSITNLIITNEGRIDRQMGVADAAALARARSLPAGDSQEKQLDAVGPILKDQSRGLEAGITQLGEMWKWNAFQFYSNKQRISLTGIAGMRDQDFDWNPDSLVPEVIEGQNKYKIAREQCSGYSFQIDPYSIHEMNSMTHKLFTLQLQRAGFPIDWWTMADTFGIANFGNPPMVPDPENPDVQVEAATVMDRWVAQQEMIARMAAATSAPTVGGMSAQTGPAAPSSQGKGGGRPPSGQDAPTLEQKSDESGTRSTIRESSK